MNASNRSMDRLGEVLEQLMADRRARITAAIVIGLVLLISMGFLAASKASPTRSAASLAEHLPSNTLRIPIMRSLPDPQPRKAVRYENRGRYVTAQR